MIYPHAFSGRRASQNKYELEQLIGFLNANKISHYLEIGAREGDTFHEIMNRVPSIEFGLAVDYPGGLWGKSTTGLKLEKAIYDLNRKGKFADFILGDSKSQTVIEEVKSYQWDAIFIDGDHTYEGVRSDWGNYGDLAPIIIFHDIVGQHQKEKVHGKPVEVPKLWAEIKEKRIHLEFIDEGSHMGIGVIVK